MVRHWTEHLFLKQGSLFLKLLKRGEDRAPEEVEMLTKIFSRLGVNLGDRVLDLCCGCGRHALRLAEKGFIVTGVDISPIAIREAQGKAKEMGVQDRVRFLVGDAREVFKLLETRQGSFKAMINMWTSIGYYDDETDRSILNQLDRLASLGCVLVIDVVNRDYLMKHFQPIGIEELEDLELHQHRKLDLETSRMENLWKFYKREGEGLKHPTTVLLDLRVYSLHELVGLLRTTGWTYIDSYGDLQLQPVTPDSNRIIIVGKKE